MKVAHSIQKPAAPPRAQHMRWLLGEQVDGFWACFDVIVILIAVANIFRFASKHQYMSALFASFLATCFIALLMQAVGRLRRRG